MNALQRLWDHGQSFWLDNLTRGMLRSGELAERVREQGLRGVTSNPAIFQKAISGGEEYDGDIARFAEAGLDVREIYDRLTIADVRDACDVLREVWEASEGLDGYVSLEVSPHLAHDTEGTLREACRLYEEVDRANVLIKIPGTPEGVPAIRRALAAGVNVNVTLLFSIGAYEAVAEAYLDALEDRLRAGSRVDDMASVASFFLSRIDTLVDEKLEAIREDADPAVASEVGELLGQAAIANAKLAYRSFRRRLTSDRWHRLAEAGARPQRMLWASTSTKDPSYSDVKYVEPLIGPLTINTMPEKTATAFVDHGTVAETVEDGMEEAGRVMERLGAVGVDFDAVTDQLLEEGVEKFVVPFDRLLATLGDRVEALAAGTRA
ncbi:MAG: transaldolase [Gemmatimonadota bacterium]|nr:transaldolase [Gemmatimonadota bacterium]